MVDAVTGNSMIPSNPGIVAQQVADGAQQVAPVAPGAPPMVGQVAAPQAPLPVAPAPVEAYDFWSSVEQRVDPGQPVIPEPAQVPPSEVGQIPPSQVPPLVPQVPPVQVQPPAQPVVPEQFPVQPPAEPVLSPDQQAAIVEAGASEALPVQPVAPAPQQDFSAMEAQTIAHLAATEYALPEAEATRLVSEPEVAFPQLAARLHVRLATQLGQAVQQILPGVIEQVVDGKMKAQQLENDFFRTYSQLADPRFRPVVANSLRMARQASPNASREQVMSDGAALAAMKLRLQLTNGAQQPVAALPVIVPPVQQPFQPAVGGGVGLPMTPQVPVNEFEVLANDPNW